MGSAEEKHKNRISRRKFLKSVGGGIIGTAAITSTGAVWKPRSSPRFIQKVDRIKGVVPITLNVNGKRYQLKVEPRTTLVNALRNELDLIGTKISCDMGECGSCTVLLNGAPVYSCMMLALEAQGADITTIEGISSGEKLHSLQEAFVKHDAMQCGFCIPGFIVALKAHLDENQNTNPDQIRGAIAGNICRCGSYPRIFEAALDASGKLGKGAGL